MSIRNGGILRAAIKHLAMISPKNRRQRSDSEPKVHELVATQSVQLVFTRRDKVVVFGVSTHGVQEHRKFLQKAVNDIGSFRRPSACLHFEPTAQLIGHFFLDVPNWVLSKKSLPTKNCIQKMTRCLELYFFYSFCSDSDMGAEKCSLCNKFLAFEAT